MTRKPLGRADRLTEKQEMFARLVAAGTPQVEAYRSAYECKPSVSLNTVKAEASRLANRPKIKTSIRRLRVAEDTPTHNPHHEVQGRGNEHDDARKTAHSAAEIRDLIVSTYLAILHDPNAKPNEKMKAGDLLGKIPGIDLNTVGEGQQEERTVEEIEADLRRLLDKMLTRLAADSEL